MVVSFFFFVYPVAAGVPTAVDDVRKKAEQGDYFSQFELGVLYFNGEGVAQNYPEAFSWFMEAAEQDYYPAKMKLEKICSNNNDLCN